MADALEKYHDLLVQKRALAHLATVQPDGSPQVTPVWFDYDGTHIRVNSVNTRVKSRNMQVGSKVALSIVDPDQPYRYVQVRGTVARVSEAEAPAHIDGLAKKYLGVDKYPWSRPGEVRALFEITPFAAQGMG
jgi:PPOX class probable F420-dependent enzyme